MDLGEKFLWGGSIAAHQCEGAWNQGGKGPGIMDLVTAGLRPAPGDMQRYCGGKHYPSHEGIDFYHRYREDIKLFAEMGFTALRFPWTGPASIRMGTMRSPMRRESPITGVWRRSC